MKYVYVYFCVYGVGGTGTRLLETSSFGTVHEMVLKNCAVGDFCITIPALFL